VDLLHPGDTFTYTVSHAFWFVRVGEKTYHFYLVKGGPGEGGEAAPPAKPLYREQQMQQQAQQP